jgi:hypothetical protein
MGSVYPSAFAANLPANFAEDDETTAADATDINAFLSADPRIGGVYQSALAAKQKRLDLAKANAGQMWQNYRDQLTQERVGPTKLERIASALTAFGAAPTRSGNFFEALNAANKNMLETGVEAAAADRSRKKMLNELGFKQAQDLAEREEAGASGIDALQLQAIKTLGTAPKLPTLVPLTKDAAGRSLNPLTLKPLSPGKDAVTTVGEEVSLADLTARYAPPPPPQAPSAMPTAMGAPPPVGAPTQGAAPPVRAPAPRGTSATYHKASSAEDAYAQPLGTTVEFNGQTYFRDETGLTPQKGVTIDTSGAEIADARATARRMNIPYNPAPMPKFQTPAKKDAYLAEVAKSGDRYLEKVNDAVDQARALASTARQFVAINQNVITGAAPGSVPAVAQSKDMRQLNQLGESLVPFLPRTPGAISNFEAVKLGSSTLSPKNPRAVNEAIGRRYEALATLTAENQDFLNKWRTVHDGSTQGADTVWSRYLKENPVFDPKYPKDARPVQGRMSFDEWANKTYYSPQKPAARPVAPKAAPAPNAPVVRGGKVQYWDRDKKGNPVLLERPKS